jgi:OOP family OmpA-OmpF porin
VPDRDDRCPATLSGVPVDEVGCARDEDADGIANLDDRCPNTPAGARVGANGCELDSDGDLVPDSLDRCPESKPGMSVDSSGCARDGDGDGIANDDDRCPNTSAGVSVDARGCELDSDGDRVADSLDRCPGTAPGTRIDAAGCPLARKIALEGVNFELGSANLTSESMDVLDEAAATLKANPDSRVEVAGHTDNTGSEALNARLSQQRAEAVRDYLIAQGAGSGRLTAKGYGADKPVADNATAAGRAKNRRVELHILDQ